MDELDSVLDELGGGIQFDDSVIENASPPTRVWDEKAAQEDALEALNLWDPLVAPPFSIPLHTPEKSMAAPALEAKRVNAVASLWSWLKREVYRRGISKRLNSVDFERWLLTSRHLQARRERLLSPSSSSTSTPARQQLRRSSGAASDPVLPNSPHVGDGVLLGQELLDLGAEPEVAHFIVEELGNKARELCNEVKAAAAQQQRTSSSSSSQPVRVTVGKGSPLPSDDLVVLEKPGLGGARAAVTRAQYTKLCALYRRCAVPPPQAPSSSSSSVDNGIGGSSSSRSSSSSSFSSRQQDTTEALLYRARRDSAILSMLLRYGYALGSSSKGKGGESKGSSKAFSSPSLDFAVNFQGSLSGAVFDVLKGVTPTSSSSSSPSSTTSPGGGALGCRLECFASPLDCRFGAYCSLHPDTDACFGSVGSFFDFDFEPGSQAPQQQQQQQQQEGGGGCFEANPPWVPEMIEDMAARMDDLLRKASSPSSTKGKEGDKGRVNSRTKKERQTLKPLCFVVVVPYSGAGANTTADETGGGGGGGGGGLKSEEGAFRQGWEALRQSPFLSTHLHLSSLDAKNGFLTSRAAFGSQQQQSKPSSQATSSSLLKEHRHHLAAGAGATGAGAATGARGGSGVGMDVSVFVLQTEAAKKKWPVGEDFSARLRKAFKTDPEQTKARPLLPSPSFPTTTASTTALPPAPSDCGRFGVWATETAEWHPQEAGGEGAEPSTLSEKEGSAMTEEEGEGEDSGEDDGQREDKPRTSAKKRPRKVTDDNSEDDDDDGKDDDDDDCMSEKAGEACSSAQPPRGDHGRVDRFVRAWIGPVLQPAPSLYGGHGTATSSKFAKFGPRFGGEVAAAMDDRGGEGSWQWKRLPTPRPQGVARAPGGKRAEILRNLAEAKKQQQQQKQKQKHELPRREVSQENSTKPVVTPKLGSASNDVKKKKKKGPMKIAKHSKSSK